MASPIRGSWALVAVALLVSSCTGSGDAEQSTTTTKSSVVPTTTTAVPTTVTTQPPGPEIRSLDNPGTVTNFARLDVSVDLGAVYENPFDTDEITLDATFTGPDGSTWLVPGFWDARETWRFRFTPSVVGDWTYSATVTDSRGTSASQGGTFSVTDSDSKGWIWPGDWVDPDLSSHYFAYLDGTPWFGLGHADLDMGFGSYNGTTFKKMAEMPDAGENFEMWWPLWTFNYVQNNYDEYQAAQMEIIDLVLQEAESNDIALAYTIWNHQLLRTDNHRWGRGLWASNGFNQLTEVGEFFTDEDSWHWQENMYRYTIARWGYSPAIAMWQTVTEINGTESYENTDSWHERLNDYFQTHDPYRHPTSATKSGGEYWPVAYEVMDVVQMHVYEQFHQNPVEAAKIMADWTVQMWEAEEKPNWIGEYGERTPRSYPEFFHNSNWAVVSAGGATGPVEWNDKNSYGQFTDVLAEDQLRLRTFIDTIPLVELDPLQLSLTTNSSEVRGWGIAGTDGGLAWVQDFALQTESFDEDEDIEGIRARPSRRGITVSVDGLAAGDFTITPYNTWTGEWLEPTTVTCEAETICEITLPSFVHDLALSIARA